MTRRTDVVVVGAGIAGVASAYFLAVRERVGKVTLIDPRPPLTLTSDKSTECYRNWWPNAPMVQLMNRSIDLLEELAIESDDVLGLSRRGYLFITADEDRLNDMVKQAEVTSSFGAGELRRHPGPLPYGQATTGADVLGPRELGTHFPYITSQAVGAIHIRRAGWFSAQQLGAWMLDRIKESGGQLIISQVVDFIDDGSRILGVQLSDGSRLHSSHTVIAAGPMTKRVAAAAGIEVPLVSELHLKAAFRDHLGVVPRDAPMIIWSDPQLLEWSEEERQGLTELGRHELLGEMPVFCHGRPEGGPHSPYFLALWEYHREVFDDPVWPLPEDPLYAEVVMKGLTTMVPGLGVYLERLPATTVDGGYYTKTVENRPLIGPAGPEGLSLVAGMSGFGVMAAAGAGDLLARHISGRDIPSYAPAFLLSRYDDPSYLSQLTEPTPSGQL